MPTYNLAINIGGKADTKHVDDASKAYKDLGKSIKNFLTAGIVLKVGKQMLTAASDVEEMQSKFNTVFKDLAGPVTADLQTFADAANRSIYDLQGFAATLQDTFVPLGFARDKAADMSVELVKLAEDLASFNNLPTQQVVEDLQSALVGNTETLRKYGVVANQSAIDQEALALGLDFTKGRMDAQTKAAAILSITMKSTTDAQGDAIKTADSYANQLKGLQAAQQELNVELGTVFLPIANDVVGALTAFTKGGAEGAAAIRETTAAADELAQQQREAAEATQNWDEYGRKLAQTMEDNTDVAFKLLGGSKFVAQEMQKTAAAAGDFSGTNEDLAASLEKVFGTEVKVSGGLVTVNGRALESVDALKQMNAEYVTNQNEAARTAYETALLGRGMSGLAATVDSAAASMHNLIQVDENGVDAANMYANANKTTTAQIFQATKAENERKMALEAERKALEEAAAAEKARTTQTANFFKSLDTETLADYQSILGATSEASVKVAGRTAEQEAALSDLRDEYEKAQQKISDYQIGVASVGLTEDERNDKITEQQERMAELQAAMDPLLAVQNEYATVTSGGTINQELLNQKIFEAIQAHSDNAAAMAIAGEALGIYTAEEAEARLQSALLDEQIRRQIEAWDGTAAGIATVQENIQNYINELNNIPTEINTTVTTNYVTTGDPTAAAGTAAAVASNTVGVRSNATGGPLMAGQLSQVGEGNRPELFMSNGRLFMIPGDNGRVFSNSDSQRMMGGITVQNLNVTVQAGGRIFNPKEAGRQVATATADELGNLI